MSSKKQAVAILDRSRLDPVWFIKTIVGAPYLTPQQTHVIESVRDNRRTLVTAGNSVGKTWLAARLALWFLYSNPRSKVITTAPTWIQVESLLWREIRLAYAGAKYPLGGEIFKSSLQIADDWFALGLSTDSPTRFQGFHAPRIMIIFDEAIGVDPGIWEASEGVAVGNDDRFLAIGNPTDPTSEAKRKDDSGLWNVIRLNAEEHPNVLNGQIVVPGAVTREWIEERAQEYGGRESSLYRARVRGLWPMEGDDVLIPAHLVESAVAKWIAPAANSKPICAGCDVARYGADETVIFTIHADGAVSAPIVRHGQNLMDTAGHLKALGLTRIGVDDAGLGGGVTDRLKEQGVSVTACIAGSSAREDGKFINARAEMWWALREALQAGDIALPPDRKLAGDLTNVKFSYDSRGRITLESKDEIKKRLGRSPDRGDALAIANWVRTPRAVFAQGKLLR